MINIPNIGEESEFLMRNVGFGGIEIENQGEDVWIFGPKWGEKHG